MPLSITKTKAAIVSQLTPKMRRLADEVTAEIKAAAPVATGRLRDGIEADFQADEQQGISVTWHDGVPYGIYQEMGTSRGVPALHFFGRSMYGLRSNLPRRLGSQ